MHLRLLPHHPLHHILHRRQPLLLRDLLLFLLCRGLRQCLRLRDSWHPCSLLHLRCVQDHLLALLLQQLVLVLVVLLLVLL